MCRGRRDVHCGARVDGYRVNGHRVNDHREFERRRRARDCLDVAIDRDEHSRR
jgi:hypothetical protein